MNVRNESEVTTAKTEIERERERERERELERRGATKRVSNSE